MEVSEKLLFVIIERRDLDFLRYMNKKALERSRAWFICGGKE